MKLYHLEGYNKLSSTLYWLDSSNNLSLIVETHKKIKETNRYFYAEYDTKNGTNIYIDFNPYLELGEIYANENGIKNKFRIANTNMYQFVMAVQTIMSWLTSKAGANLFVKAQDGTIKVNPKFQPVKIAGVFEGQKLEIAPSVRYNELGTEAIPGICIFVNDSSEPIFMNISQYLNFAYFIEHFNLYEAGMQLVNFLGRPEPITPNQSNNDYQQHQQEKKSFFSITGAKKREGDDNP